MPEQMMWTHVRLFLEYNTHIGIVGVIHTGAMSITNIAVTCILCQ